ncbi:hypothetical protein [uncultured Ruminococcus sp.]|uniref:hypothetical protein n=1 Tax=uncultured Ruminococcus sp. TaxID=165186 RepID=UPI0025F4C3FE|nr:hypothetical protein [uncultured Ruminococcus sp.]
MQIPHQTYKIDLNNINEPLTRMIESVNDKGVRFVDVELWANSQKVTLPQNCTATAAFVTDGFLINESVDCSISDDLTTVIVPIDNANIESKSGIMLVEIKITENGNILTPPFAFKVRVKKSITEDANVFEKSYGTVSEILKEVAEARGNSKTLKDEIATKADKTEVDTALATKADKATTLSGYRITDGENIGNKVADKIKITDESTNYPSIKYLNTYYYDFDDVDEALSGKLDNTSGAVKTDNIANKAVTNEKIANGAITALKIASGAVSGSNIAQYQINTNHLQNGAVTTDKLADEIKTGISSKYDSSNVETGSGTLTPYTTSADIVKSADFTYQRVGRVVTVNVNIVFNAGAKSQVMFTNLPYVCKNTVNPRELCVSNSRVSRIWAINKNNTILNIISDSSLSYADGETLAFTLSYLVS